MDRHCHFCHRELEPTHYYVITGQEPTDIVRRAIWVDTTLGRIGVCNICYEREHFYGLTSEDIGAIHYMFGWPFSDDEDIDYQESVAILTKASALLPVPEVLSALGYAHWRAGDQELAARLCRDALERQPHHFGHEKARKVIDNVTPRA
jgi:hypothetical protein